MAIRAETFGPLTVFDPGQSIVTRYALALRGATSLGKLHAVTAQFLPVAGDAHDRAQAMTEAEFAQQFLPGMRKEAQGIYAGPDWNTAYGVITMPELLVACMVRAERTGISHNAALFGLLDRGVVAYAPSSGRIERLFRLSESQGGAS